MKIWQLLLFLSALTVIAYFSSLWNEFVWDDQQFIYDNVYVLTLDLKNIFTQSTTAGSGVVSNYYRPLTTLSFALTVAIFGLHEFPFHLTNILLHLSSGLILFFILLELTQQKKLSFFVSLIFLIHPIQTEAVTYINSRGDSLYTFFGLLSLVGFIQLAKQKIVTVQLYNLSLSLNQPLLIVGVATTYAASILSKEIGITIVGLQLLVFLYIQLQKHTPSTATLLKKNWEALTSLAVQTTIAASYLLLRETVLNFNNSFKFEGHLALYSGSLLVRLLTFSKVIFIYLRLLLIPYPLHMERTTDLVTSIFSPWPIAALTLIGLILFLSWKEYTYKKTLSIIFGFSWFSICLLPVSGIIPINGILYEHWLYLPLVGFFICLIGLLNFFVTNHLRRIVEQYWLQIIFFCCLFWIPLTIRQNYLWSTPIRLYEYLLHYTTAARIHNNLGMAYADQKEYKKAIEHYTLALSAKQTYSAATTYNLGNVYRDTGDIKMAIEYYKKSIEGDPSFFYSYIPLISMYAKDGQLTAARQLAQQAQTQFPYNFQYSLIELEILGMQKDMKEAQALMKKINTLTTDQSVLQTARGIYAKYF